jgi:hypothetical protein
VVDDCGGRPISVVHFATKVDKVTSQGAFVFAEDGVDFYQTIEEAARSIEAVDVEDGVYEAFFTRAGEPLRPEILDEIKVDLRPSGIAVHVNSPLMMWIVSL